VGRRLPWTLLGITSLFVLWELASRLYGASFILPAPVPVLANLASLMWSRAFLLALGNTFLRVMLGIAVALPVAVALGLAAGLDGRIEAFLRPLFSVVAATPVISVILIAFLLLGSGGTPVFTACLMVFPVMAANALEGVRCVDPKLKELFSAFGLDRRARIRFLYLPSLAPFIVGGIRSSLSLCWKVVVAAEVLVQPLAGLGTGMQMARAHLRSPELFAWTFATILAAAFSQILLTRALALFGGRSGRKRFA